MSVEVNLQTTDDDRAATEAFMDARLAEIDRMLVDIQESQERSRKIGAETKAILDRLDDLLPDPFVTLSKQSQGTGTP